MDVVDGFGGQRPFRLELGIQLLGPEGLHVARGEAPSDQGPVRFDEAKHASDRDVVGKRRANRVALPTFVQQFEGPLDLLLYLIRQEQVDIYDIPIARITDEYLRYLRLMQGMDITVAGDFLVMAATLIEIKSKMLLPQELKEEAEEETLRLLREAVKLRLISEVPLGAFLSGGVDSSTIVGLMSQISAKRV